MKTLDLRKFVFSYIYIILACVGIYFLLKALSYPSPKEDIFFADGTFEFFIGSLCILAYYWCCGLLLIEILLQQFVIPKLFPNFKFSIKITITRKLNIILTIIFYILFLIASIPLVITLIAFFIY